MQVVCLCARWCQVCVAYQETFQAVATRFEKHCFASLDIEDDAALLESVGAANLADVEDFPTLLLVDETGILFLGAITPQSQTLERLIRAGENSSLARRQPKVSLEDLQPLLQGIAQRGLWL